ncbi:NAD-dependent protein deacylase [Archaeoglobales archaeon]|nr:MAG: NAD-dependent protein deacylase [Archaeoglobales archaeon]
MEIDKKIEEVAKLLRSSKHVVVFTGAGISVESGIPPFRGVDGLWNRYDPEEVASIYGFKRNPKAFWEFARELLIKTKAEPNKAHYAIAELEKMGIVKAVITQNIDMLHQKAGSNRVLELHGSMEYVDCLDCHTTYEWGEIEKRIEKEIPKCESCGGYYLKPRVVFFGEALPRDVLSEAMEESRKCDVFVVVGSSLVVYPAAHLPFIAKENKAKLVIVNRDPTEKDAMFDVVIHGKAGEILPKIVEKLNV